MAIIFGGFENITIWQRFNSGDIIERKWLGSILFHLETTNFGEIY